LASYLLLPRPKDAPKAALLPVAFAIGAVAAGGVEDGRWVPALVCWLTLELLVYQARYQWNDVRGFAADQRHPDRVERGRLPGPVERARAHVTASVAVAAARLLTAVGVAALLPRPANSILAASSVAVFGVAAVYELVRTRATGRTSVVPPPLRPALVGLWFVVGAGYAVRGLTGLALAVALTDRPLLVAAATVLLWSFGVMYATTAWALEATAFARFRDGTVRWSVEHRQAREHQLALVRWLPQTHPSDVGSAGTILEAREWPALRGRTDLRAPWNLAVLVSGAAAGLTGRLLVGPASPGEAVGSTLAAAVAAAVVLLAPRHRMAVAALGAASLGGLFEAAGAPRPAAAVLPWIAAVGAYLVFSNRSLSTRGRSIARFGSMIQRLARRAARAAIGPDTFELVQVPGERNDQPGPSDRPAAT
jgi:hypothetical protein